MNNMLENIAERWDTHADKYDIHHHGHKTEEDINMWKDVLKDYLGSNKNVQVLDVGAGTGFLTLLIAELGYTCTGLDISSGMLDIAKKQAFKKGLNVKFIQSAAEKLPFEDNHLDVITNCSFMWTLLNPEIVLKEWFRTLKSGGKLLSFCTIGNGIMQGNHYSQEIEDALPLKNASEEQLITLVSNVGFSNVEAIRLEGLKNHHGDKTWYLIKGNK